MHINIKLLILAFSALLVLPFILAQTTFYENPSDFYLFQTIPTLNSDNIVSNQGSVYSSSGCLTDWNCSSWSECINSTQTRNCTKIYENCYSGTTPEEIQSCNVSAQNKNSQLNFNLTQTNPKGGPGIGGLSIIFLILGVLLVILIVFLLKRNKQMRNPLS